MKRQPFVENEIYHIYNRGVEKRDVFMEDGDYVRFIHSLFFFNDQNPTLNLGRDLMNEAEFHSLERSRKLLVEIMAFCAMKNHYHLLLRQKVDGGIVKFMQKFGTAYTNYFNKKYKRVGHLFQGRFKARIIEKDAHFLYIPYYLHLNPLDFKFPKWRDGGIKNINAAMAFLEKYRWSSYLDYIGKHNFPSVTQREFLSESIGGSLAHQRGIKEWLQISNPQRLQTIGDFSFEK